MTRLLLLLLVIAGCASQPVPQAPVAKAHPSDWAPSDEVDFSLGSKCQDTPDYRIQKAKGDPCLHIDGFKLCRMSRVSPKGRAMYQNLPNDVKFGKFHEVAFQDTIRSGKKTEKRQSCDLTFDVEISGKTEPCYYNRHLKDVEIHCPAPKRTN